MTWGKVVDMWSTGVLLAEMMVCSEQCTADVNEKRKYFPLMIIPDERAMYQEDQQLRDKTIRRIFEVIPMKDQQFINPQTEDVVYAFRGKALGVHRDAGDTEGFYRVLGKAKNQVMGSVLRGCLMMDWSQRKTSLEVAEMLGMASPPKQAGVKFDLPATYQDYVEVLSSLRAKDSEKENNESE